MAKFTLIPILHSSLYSELLFMGLCNFPLVVEFTSLLLWWWTWPWDSLRPQAFVRKMQCATLMPNIKRLITCFLLFLLSFFHPSENFIYVLVSRSLTGIFQPPTQWSREYNKYGADLSPNCSLEPCPANPSLYQQPPGKPTIIWSHVNKCFKSIDF